MNFDWPILILSDDRDTADFVRFSLVDAGWDARRVRWTDSLAGARKHLRQGTPGVIVTTLTLPDAADEIVLFEALRQGAPDVPIVAIGATRPVNEVGNLGGGAHAYVAKNMVEQNLVEGIRTAVERLRFERQLQADQAANLDRRQSESLGRLAEDTGLEVHHALAAVSAALTDLETALHPSSVPSGAFSSAREGIARAERAVDALRAASGRRTLVQSRIDLKPLLERERVRLDRAAGPSIDVDTWIAPDLPAMLGDARALVQVLGLLVGRAGARTADGGTVTVRAERSANDPQIEIRVLDGGPPPAVGATPRQDALLLRARALVEQQGGSLEISARRSTGVQARLCLPHAPTASD